MRAVITRVREASVTIDGQRSGAIGRGLLVLLAIGPQDDVALARRMAEKICSLRIFPDEGGKMNLDLTAVGGALLVVSQFTLYADTKSRRPGFTGAAKPDLAQSLYEAFLSHCEALGHVPQRGEFGADMDVSSINEGPVTIWLDSAQW